MLSSTFPVTQWIGSNKFNCWVENRNECIPMKMGIWNALISILKRQQTISILNVHVIEYLVRVVSASPLNRHVWQQWATKSLQRIARKEWNWERTQSASTSIENLPELWICLAEIVLFVVKFSFVLHYNHCKMSKKKKWTKIIRKIK